MIGSISKRAAGLPKIVEVDVMSILKQISMTREQQIAEIEKDAAEKQYQEQLVSARRARDMGFSDSQIEQLYGVVLRPEDRADGRDHLS